MTKIYYGGDIITMENEEDSPEALVEQDGVIRYVGSLNEARECAGNLEVEITERDLNGKTLMPAFIDPHSHISMTAQFAAFAQLKKSESFGDIADVLEKYKNDNGIKQDGIIMGCGYDHNFLIEQTHPDISLLDRVSDEIPIFIFHTSGHMGVANSALLKFAGITDDTPDPEGGRYGRDEDGRLNGYVEETPALTVVLQAAYPRLKMDFVRQMVDAQDLYLKHGITTVQDGAAGLQTVDGIAALAANRLLKLDVISYVMTDDYRKAAEKYPELTEGYSGNFRIGGAKIVLDGSPQGKSAWLSRPYEGEESCRGYPTHKDDEVKAAMVDSIRDRHQILVHCNGDAASEQFLDAYENALNDCGVSAGELDLRPTMIHCQTVRDDQLDRMAEMKMIPSIYVAHTYFWGDVHLKNLGEDRGNHISPAKEALKRGLVYNFHQDTPVLDPDMFRTIWCAVNRETRTGTPIGKDQAIGVYDALKGVTINAAYAYHEEASKGSLAPGKQANFVIADASPLKTEKEKLCDIKVLETIRKGETLYKRS